MYRVLVFGMTENPGGVESVIINYYRCIDKTKIQMDFLCNFHEPAAYENELRALGGEVYHITARSDNYRKYKKELQSFFSGDPGKIPGNMGQCVQPGEYRLFDYGKKIWDFPAYYTQP